MRENGAAGVACDIKNKFVREDCLAEHEHYKAQTTKVKDHWNYLRLSFYNDLALEVKGPREVSRSKGKKSSS